MVHGRSYQEMLKLYGFNATLADSSSHPAVGGCILRLQSIGKDPDELRYADYKWAWDQAEQALPPEQRPTLYSELKSIHVPMDNSSSDLLVPYRQDVIEVLQKYPQDRKNAKTFISQIEKTTWIDIPFAYMPWWKSRAEADQARRDREKTNVDQ